MGYLIIKVCYIEYYINYLISINFFVNVIPSNYR